MANDSATYALAKRLIGRVLDPGTSDALMALLPVLMNKEPLPMADIAQALADLNTAVQGVSDRTASDVAALKAEIEVLKAQGVNTTQLAAIADSVEKQVTSLNAIDVPAVPVTPPAPDPVPAPVPAPVVDPVPAPPVVDPAPVPAPPVVDPVPAPVVDPTVPPTPAP